MTWERSAQDQQDRQDQRAQHRTPTVGETAARIEGALALVDRVVAQVCGSYPPHVDRNELRRAGALGLVEAARRWDATRGVPFEGYAVLRIRGAVLDAARAADWAPRPVRTMARRIEAAEQALVGELGRRPTETELVERMGVGLEELRRVRTLLVRLAPLALDRSRAGDDEDSGLIDLVIDLRENEPDEQLERRELLGYLHDAIDLLPDRHRMIIIGTFFDGRPSVELASELGVTESRISQLRAEAIAQLRWGISSQYHRTASPESGSRRREEYAAAIARARRWDQRFDEERRMLEGPMGETA
ncbi:MAG: sigma-70 family RNA polymerase sigma factor [Actinobacteria bacterium]|nr:sigma-70 family RNA polymerase sigma factor [Actinomycetota bacterium]